MGGQARGNPRVRLLEGCLRNAGPPTPNSISSEAKATQYLLFSYVHESGAGLEAQFNTHKLVRATEYRIE